MRISDWSSDVCSSDLWWCGGTGKRKVARAVTARKLLSSVAAQQPQAEPVLRIVPPLRNAQPRFGRQRNETGVGVLVAVLDLHRLACIEVEAPPFDGHVLRTAADQEGLAAAGLAQVRGAVLETGEIEVAAEIGRAWCGERGGQYG